MRSMTLWIGAVVFTIGAGVFLIEREYISGDKVARVRLEQGKLQLERYDEDGLRKGIDDLTAVIAQFPDSVHAREARYYLAEGYERLGMRDVALGKYKKLLEMPLTDSLKSRTRFKVAKLHIMRNYSDEGMNQLLQLLNSTSDKALRSEIYLEIGKYYQRKGLDADAKRNFQNALTENPDNREAQAALGQGNGDYTNSVALHGILDKQSAATPEATASKDAADKTTKVATPVKKYDLQAGIQAFTTAQYQRAIGLLAPAAQSSSPESEDALYYLGNSYLKLKQYRNAVHYLNKAVGNSYTSKDEASYIKKGEAYYLDSKYQRALGVFRFVTTHYPHGKYAQIAQDWETEARRMLGEQIPMRGEDVEATPVDDADEDAELLSTAIAGDEAAPRPKRKSVSKVMPTTVEDITLDDDADVTP
jgi:tetratricopeptide (TPR) repeat protein